MNLEDELKCIERLLERAEDSGNIDAFNFYYAERERVKRELKGGSDSVAVANAC